MNKENEANKLLARLQDLTDSPLYQFRTENNYKPVLGDGNLNADLVFIGEAPGKNEALTGKPFVGAAGKILNSLLEEINLKREDIYITNIVNDRPPQNRDPKPQEIALYTPILDKLLEIIQPKVIATLGRFSMEFIMVKFGLKDNLNTITNLHGKFFETKTSWGSIKVVPLYHPAATIYNQKLKPELEEDFKKNRKITLIINNRQIA